MFKTQTYLEYKLIKLTRNFNLEKLFEQKKLVTIGMKNVMMFKI